ncbi:O-antigen ligase family protein [Acinetobacter nosocomialis]|uniref:O-antigen ligase family protein n=1 Tax=Acinetobacter nosocomialis TaxID=106654 RepID=UPI000DE61BAB|nr:O-antigen ligase family protein [Acinetobacter nosocomialis]SSR56697.1 O-antigen ligase [Acinetobacter baumannii]MBO8209238.1 O-antigen ligase family protein [Acinetobacter nosocomialis]MBO8225689.1 O-antigen ligase family protein [Acinetobacter nosocomialis]MBO8251095.1 O-antigen ligase family protein [Acinetobacter nosocomialis]MBR7690073.1 O-antigen ligase family protein [Acinetobacter nosocomialis]
MLKNNILFLLIGFYLIAALLGYQVGWSIFQYDELRLLQFPLALCALLIMIFTKKIGYSIYTHINFFIIGLFILIQQINWGIFEFQELWSAIALLFIFSTLTYELRSIKNIQHSIVLIIVSAFIPCLFILISITNFIIHQQWFNWQFNSGTIRIYDSVIVPLFFFLIFLQNKKYPYLHYFYPFAIFFFSLACFFDGARSALSAIITGLLIFFLLSKENRRLALKTTFYIFAAFIVYKSTVYFAKQNTMTVIRAGTSLRAEMWYFVFDQWKQYPFTGVGGGYLSKIQYKYGHHIHNLYLRLIFEWGMVGCIFLVWMTYQFIKLFLDKEILPIAKAGVAAILIDAMFSGNMVYPASQIACILFLAFAFSQSKLSPSSKYSSLFTKVLIGLWGALFLYITIMYLGQDLMCWGCGSYVGRMAPNFWFYGGAEHLVPVVQIP